MDQQVAAASRSLAGLHRRRMEHAARCMMHAAFDDSLTDRIVQLTQATEAMQQWCMKVDEENARAR